MFKKLACGIVVIATGALMSAQVAATEIRIDLSDTVSTTGGTWNDITDGSLNAVTAGLIDFGTGLATGVSIAGSGWRGFFGVDAAAQWPDKDWVVSSSTFDGAGLDNGATGTFSLAGLSDSASYQVEIVSARTTFNYLNTIIVDGGAADRTFNGTPVNTPWASTADGLTPQNWLIWDDLMAAGGMLSISVTADVSTLGMINAIRILEVDQVPEPATAAIMLTGLLGFGFARRRKA